MMVELYPPKDGVWGTEAAQKGREKKSYKPWQQKHLENILRRPSKQSNYTEVANTKHQASHPTLEAPVIMALSRWTT